MKKLSLSIFLLSISLTGFNQDLSTIGSNPVTGSGGFLCSGGFVNPAGISVGGKSNHTTFWNVTSIGCTYYLHATLNGKANAGTYAGFHISGTSLISVLDMITVETYTDGVFAERSNSASLLRLITAGEGDLFFATTKDYNEVRIVFKPTIALLEGVKIYYGYASNYNPLFPLPLSIFAEGISQKNNTSLLTWKVAEFESIERQEVQFSSVGIDFQTIAVINSKGPVYSYYDKKAKNGVYRIRIQTKQGQILYSKGLYSKMVEDDVELTYVNPTRTFSTIQVTIKKPGYYTIRMTNSLGVPVYQKPTTSAATIQLSNIPFLTKDVYSIAVIAKDGRTIKTGRFIFLSN